MEASHSKNYPLFGIKSWPKDDQEFTKELFKAGKIMQVKVLDHVIIGDNDYYSFADEGILVH